LGSAYFAPKIYRNIKEKMKGDFVFGTPNTEQNLADGIVVVITVDDGYCHQALVTLTSLLMSAKKTTFYKINVFVPREFGDESKKKLLTLEKTYSENCTIEFISMEDCFTNSYISAHFTNVVYYRLRAPSVLNKRSRCIYMDTDIIVEEDLSELFEIDLQGRLLGGVLDSASGYRNEKEKMERESYQKAFNIKTLDHYINSGVLLWDLDACRAAKVEDRFRDFLKKYKNPSQHDQTTINASLSTEEILLLDFRFNTQAYMFSEAPYGQDKDRFSLIFDEKQWKTAWERPCIIHFAGEKPWKDPSTYWIEKWWNVARITPFAEDIIKQFRTTK
jgi:lipopolysaccharide biosynthesis glycosyltransferase